MFFCLCAMEAGLGICLGSTKRTTLPLNILFGLQCSHDFFPLPSVTQIHGQRSVNNRMALSTIDETGCSSTSLPRSPVSLHSRLSVTLQDTTLRAVTTLVAHLTVVSPLHIFHDCTLFEFLKRKLSACRCFGFSKVEASRAKYQKVPYPGSSLSFNLSSSSFFLCDAMSEVVSQILTT